MSLYILLHAQRIATFGKYAERLLHTTLHLIARAADCDASFFVLKKSPVVNFTSYCTRSGLRLQLNQYHQQAVWLYILLHAQRIATHKGKVVIPNEPDLYILLHAQRIAVYRCVAPLELS